MKRGVGLIHRIGEGLARLSLLDQEGDGLQHTPDEVTHQRRLPGHILLAQVGMPMTKAEGDDLPNLTVNGGDPLHLPRHQGGGSGDHPHAIGETGGRPTRGQLDQ